MGMLFTGKHTAKICARLNRRFSDDNLEDIRKNPKKMAKFLAPLTNKRTLARIAYKSGTYPSNSPRSKVAKRWFYFLKNNVNASVALQIRQALLKGLTDTSGGGWKYNALVFVAFEGNVMRFSTEDLDVLDPYDNPTGKSVLLFKLQTARIDEDVEYDASATKDPDEVENDEPNEGVPDPEVFAARVRRSRQVVIKAKKAGPKRKVAKKKAVKKKKT